MNCSRRCLGWVLVPFVVILWGEILGVRTQGQRPLAVSLFPPSINPGDVVRIDVAGTPEDRIAGTIFDRELDFAFDHPRSTWTALAGVDLDSKPGSYPLRIRRGGAPAVARTIQILSKQFPVRRLRVASNFVDPPPETLEQIAADSRTLAAIYARTTPRQWTGAFLAPVDGAPTSNFGTRSYYNGQRRSPHAGVDFMSKSGTPIRASNHGVVALAAPLYFTGNTVIVDYGAGVMSVFAHLSELRVKAGDVVAPDTIVGLVGATGRVTGPHLHWSVRLNGARVDPQSLIAATRVPASPTP